MNEWKHFFGGAVMGMALAWLMEQWVKYFFLKLNLENPEEFSNSHFQQKEDQRIKIFIYFFLTLMVAGMSQIRQWKPELMSDLILVFALIGTAWIDWKTLLIEVRLVTLAMILRIVWLLTYHPEEIKNSLAGLLMGAGLLYLIGFLYEAFRQRQGLGEGDAAVLGLIGMWVGWQGLGPVLLIAAISGILISALVLLRSKMDKNIADLLQVQVPFAPFLCIGGISVHVMQQMNWIFMG